MGKRSAAIVISSSDDDEGGEFVSESNLRNSKLKPKSKSKSASVPRTNPKRAKKAPLSGSSSLPRHPNKYSGFDEINRFCNEFDMGFNEFKVAIAGLTCGSINTSLVLWKSLLFTRRRLKKSKHGLRKD